MMRAALLIAILSGWSGQALALTDEECTQAAHLAESIMTARQNGTSLEKALSVLTDNVDDPAAVNAGKQLIIEAYKQPRYNSEEIQQRTIGDFRDNVHVACLTGAN